MCKHSDIVVFDDHQCHGQRQHLPPASLTPMTKNFLTGVTTAGTGISNTDGAPGVANIFRRIFEKIN
jgi:hypothetical protein